MPKISRRAMMAAALPLAADQTPANSFFGIYGGPRPGYVQPAGIWVDGECWQTNPDYSPASLDAWRRMGLGMDAPRKPEDPIWDVWLEFNRQRFRDCARNHIDRLRKDQPGLPITSNSLYTTYVPEKPELLVDFLINAGMSHVRLETRYLAQTGKPWAYRLPHGEMKRDASVALAQGGGIQIPLQKRDIVRAAFQFCRERQSLCHRSQSLSDVAILFSRTSLYRKSNQLFGDWGKHVGPCSELLDALIACHCSVDVMPDWAPLKWPVLVIPEWEEIGDALAHEIASQVRSGLKLLLTGPANAKKFASLFGSKFDSSREAPVHEIGKGRVVLASGPGLTVEQCLVALGPAQISIKDRTAPLEIALRKQGQQTVLHFLNRVNTLPGQQVRLRLSQAPKKILWEPSGRAIKFEWRDGYAAFETPPIPLHAMAVID